MRVKFGKFRNPKKAEKDLDLCYATLRHLEESIVHLNECIHKVVGE